MDSGNAAATDAGRLRSLYAATQQLMRASTREELCWVAVDTAEDVLGLPLVGAYLHEEGTGLVPAAATSAVHDRFDEAPTYSLGGLVHNVYRTGSTFRVDGDDRRGSDDDLWTGVVVPVDGYGVLIAGADERNPVGDEAVELLELLADNAASALDRLERERRLDRLHEATRELMTTDTASVAAVTTDTAHEVLGLRRNAVYLLSSDGDRLVPVSVTSEARDTFGTVPDLEPGGVGWGVFRSGEAEVYDDAQRARNGERGTPVRSEMLLPLGDHGVFFAGAPDPGAFSESDIRLARVLADNVEAAFDRAEQEELLRARECELARQNQRLEEFASVVSHDLRNPLNVAEGRLQLAREDDGDDSPHLDQVASAHERMESLVDDLLALARNGQSVGDTEPVGLAPLARETWEGIDGDADAALRVEGDLGSVDADESRLRELFENLFRNAVDHAGAGVAVTAGPLDDRAGFYVADDGPGIPSDDRDQVFSRGFTTASDGTGFGLAIVRDIAEAHGWTVSVHEAAGGGARFEVETDPDCPDCPEQ